MAVPTGRCRLGIKGITNSYATGTSTGIGAAGFVSDNQKGDTVSYSYSTGVVPSGSGGFVCTGSIGDFADDYWDTTTSGAEDGACEGTNINGIGGLTTQELQGGLPSGFDPTIWAENPKINKGFPYLIANPPSK
jgi:hypothetical protein